MFSELFAFLKLIGFRPRLIFDIGAYEGQFIDQCRSHFPESPCWAFEPNLEKQQLLKAKADRVFSDVLNDVAGEVDYWETAFPIQTGNSIYRENTNVPFRATRRQCVGIDSLVGDRVPDLVKLDTQGSELAILRGGGNSICRAEVIIVETHVRRWNQGAPLFADLFEFLTSKNFRLIDFFDTLRVGHALIQADVAFMNRDSRHYAENAFVNV